MLLFSALAGVAAAASHSIVWAPPAQQLTVSVGDTVTFSWTDTHNVFSLPDATAFGSCDFTSGTELAATVAGGSFVWTATSEGEFFFGCQLPFHCSAGFKAQISVIAGASFTVQLGGSNQPDARGLPSWYLMANYPGSLTINVGDTVHFHNVFFHTVTFVNSFAALFNVPFLGGPTGGNVKDATNELHSGILEPGQTFDVTFTAVGTFTYYCRIHPGMFGTITVLPQGEALPAESTYDQAAIDQAVAADLATIPVQTILHGFTGVGAAVAPNPDGTWTHYLRAGGNAELRPGAMLTFFRWVPDAPLKINTGDTVRIVFSDSDHAVSLSNDTVRNAFSLPQWASRAPTPSGTAWKPSQIPGQIISSVVTFVPGTYDIVFAEAGTFRLDCWVHTLNSGMWTTIVVSDPVDTPTCPPCDGTGTTINFNFANMFGSRTCTN